MKSGEVRDMQLSRQVRFEIPDDFVELELDADEARVQEIVRARAEEHATAEWFVEGVIAAYRETVLSLRSANALYAGTCMGLIEGRLSMASLVLSSSPTPHSDAQVAVSGIMQAQLARHGTSCAAQKWSLPCGPAVVIARPEIAVFVPGEHSESGEDEATAVALAQAYVPVPGDGLLFVTLSTPMTEHWEEYCKVFARLLRTISFNSMNSEPEG